MNKEYQEKVWEVIQNREWATYDKKEIITLEDIRQSLRNLEEKIKEINQ